MQSSKRRGSAIAATVVIALGLPAPAHGATASVQRYGYQGSPEARAVYQAAPGEPNRVTVTVVETDGEFVVTFHDAGAPVKPGAGCVAVDPSSARCAPEDLTRTDVHLRDGSDTLRTEAEQSGYRFDLHGFGGRGADTLTGSPLDEAYDGGPGADSIAGLGGNDKLAGGTGHDRLYGGRGGDFLTGEYFGHAGTPASDYLDGGHGGEDSVGYYGGRVRVNIDLRRGTATGAAGEEDRLSGIENAGLLAGTGTLIGDDRWNSLWVDRGAGGAVLRGRAGNDNLDGGEHPDAIYGGRGNDDLEAGGGMGDRLYAGRGRDTLRIGGQYGIGSGWSRAVHCGRGADVVHQSRRHDILARDCEQASSYVRLGVSPDLRRIGNDAVELSLHRRGPHTSCRYAIRLRAPFPQRRHARPREIGRLVFRLDRETWRRIRIELNDYGRRLLARDRRVPVWVQPGALERCNPDTPHFGPDGFTAML